ncbi:MAG: hypothetical protein KAT62_02570 [Desulfuromonadales bacterium]|nr:hypothetical protein [Desulfuromonadales bacterium]
MSKMRDRILASKDYLEGEEFTIARAVTQLDGAHKESVSAELNSMTVDGLLTKRYELRGDRNINFYSRASPSKSILARTWVKYTPPNESPVMC